MSALRTGQRLIVTKAMPCQGDLFGRFHATIRLGRQITILEPAPDSEKVRFSVVTQGQEESFTAFQTTIERCCGGVKPAAPKEK